MVCGETSVVGEERYQCQLTCGKSASLELTHTTVEPLKMGGGVLFIEVSSFQRLKCVQEWYLGWVKVPFLQFWGVLIERFHCSACASSHDNLSS